MKRHRWKKNFVCLSVMTMLLSFATVARAGDADQDGIDDSLETTGGVSFGSYTYLPCSTNPPPTQGAARNACVSPSSKDIFVYLVIPSGGGGFLQANGLINAAASPPNVSVLFQFLTGPVNPVITTTTTAKLNGLNVGVHAAVVSAAPTNRAVPAQQSPYLGQLAVVMTVDETLNEIGFGSTDQGTPTATGRSRISPVKAQNFIRTIFGQDTPSVWKPYVQRTASHELSHAAALEAVYNSALGQYHLATGSGTVMDHEAVCNSKKKTCAIYNVYASADRPCLLSLVTPITNPLQCAPLQPIIIVN